MIREYVIEYAEDRIGIGMIENRRKGGGGRAWEWAGIVRGYVGVESSRMWAWKVRGKFEGVKTRGRGLECSMGRALKVRGFL